MSETSVYITDDHKLLVEGLQELLRSAGFKLAGISYDGRSAVAEILRGRPDVVLMDLDLPEINGLEALRQILKDWPEARVIIMTMHLEKSLIEKAVQTGARGYLPKNVSKEEFIRAIEELAAGRCYYSPEATRSLAFGTNTRMLSTEPDLVKMAASLSQREEEVLKAIAEGFSNREIAECMHLSVHTIDSHRKHIMQKTGTSNTAGLIRFALKSGLSY